MNPVLQDVPEEFYTERLHIRMPRQGDGQAVYEAMQESKKELTPWLPFMQNDQTLDETEINLREAIANYINRTDLRLLMFHRETGEFVGSTGLHRIKWEVPRFEIGYWVDTRWSGKGYVTEMVKGLSTFCFDTLHARRVEIRCDRKNLKSAAVAERAGFTLDAILKNESVGVTNPKELRDTCLYSIVK